MLWPMNASEFRARRIIPGDSLSAVANSSAAARNNKSQKPNPKRQANLKSQAKYQNSLLDFLSFGRLEFP
jgi:hypothetical protein